LSCGSSSAWLTSATLVIYGQAVWDPVQRLSRFGRPVLQVVGLVGLGMATLATNLAAGPTTSPTSGSAASPSVSGR
jgi:nucleobase:cation symporter-1, NCS1 family